MASLLNPPTAQEAVGHVKPINSYPTSGSLSDREKKKMLPREKHDLFSMFELSVLTEMIQAN